MRIFLLLVFCATIGLMAQVQRPVEDFTGGVKITPIRHASMMIQAGGKVIQVDPWSEGNYDGVPQADLILITDIHPDHLDKPMIDRLSKAGTIVIAPEAVAKTITHAKVLRNGESTTWDTWKIDA